MTTSRSLLTRVAKLEQSRANPMLSAFGGQHGWEQFQAEAKAGIAAGRYDSQDMPVVVEAIRAWLDADF